MADVQTENGYTRIANAILENIAKLPLNGTQLKILLVVWRSTYGFNKKNHPLSLTYLSSACGCTRASIKSEVKNLINYNILIESAAPTFNASRELTFNKDFELYRVTRLPQGKNSYIPQGKETTTLQGKETTPKKDIYKDNIKTEGFADVFQHYMSLDLIKHKHFTDAMKKAIEKAIKSNKYTIEDCKMLLDRHEAKVKETKDNSKPILKRSLDAFFGQKVYNAQHLICSEYEDGGKHSCSEEPRYYDSKTASGGIII